jgi:Capsule polysaccharide biosynthesis protein
LSIVFFGHDITYALLCRALADVLPPDQQPIFYCNRPGLFWFARNRLGLKTIRAGRGRLTVKLLRGQLPPFDLDLKFFSDPNADTDQWAALAKWHYDQAAFQLNQIEPNLIISPGEYRITEQAFVAAARDLFPNTPLIYFEAGPGTYVYLDPTGVNANASFAQSEQNEAQHKLPISGVSKQQSRNYRQLKSSLPARLATLADMAWILAIQCSSPTNEFKEYVAAIRNRWRVTTAKFNRTGSVEEEHMPGNYLLFVDQVRSDVNATHFGADENEVYLKIEQLLELRPEMGLVWRSHPLELRDDLFHRVKALAPVRVIRSGSQSFGQQLAGASAILTVNSNGGLDALLAGRPVLLFGKSYYQNLTGVVRDPAALDSLLRLDLLNSAKISSEAGRFIENCFIPVDYRGCDFKNVSALADHALFYASRRGGRRIGTDNETMQTRRR